MPNFSREHEGCHRVLVVLELHLSRANGMPGRRDAVIRDDIVHAFLHRSPGAINAVHLPSDGSTAIRRIVREDSRYPDMEPFDA